MQAQVVDPDGAAGTWSMEKSHRTSKSSNRRTENDPKRRADTKEMIKETHKKNSKDFLKTLTTNKYVKSIEMEHKDSRIYWDYRDWTNTSILTFKSMQAIPKEVKVGEIIPVMLRGKVLGFFEDRHSSYEVKGTFTYRTSRSGHGFKTRSGLLTSWNSPRLSELIQKDSELSKAGVFCKFHSLQNLLNI